MENAKRRLLTAHPLAIGARAGALIDTGRFSVKRGSICLVAGSSLVGCKTSVKSSKTFLYSASGTLRAVKLGLDHTVSNSLLCWKILAWYGTFETGDRALREKLFLEIKNEA
jgi:hypothetical protein